MRRKIRIMFFIKIITFIILTWIYMCSVPEVLYQYMNSVYFFRCYLYLTSSIFCKCLSNHYILGERIIIRNDRLLAIQETQGESNKMELENNFSSNVDDSEIKKSATNVSLNKNIKKASNKYSQKRKSGYNRTCTINKRLLRISYIYNYIKSIDYSIKDVVLGHSEKSNNHNLNEVITNKTIEHMLCKDYILINSVPLSVKLKSILLSIFEDINEDIAIKSIHVALVIIFTHKYSHSTYGMNKSLDSLIFLTLMITCLSQIFYTIGEYMIRNKYENIILEDKRQIKEKYEKKEIEKKEINQKKKELKKENKQKKREEKAEKKKQKIEKLKDLETYMNEYNDRY
ncbi:variable surface protein, partial [Plasmodium gonderi]